ncbi:MAG: NAD-dependent epimerase/dehydratase family protein [Saprospiraceae bacterium]
MKKILITGASGFIGSTLVEEALKHEDWDVHAGVRTTSSRKYLTDQRIRFFEMNFSDVAELTEKLQAARFDYIIHNAGATAVPKKADYFRINTDYVKNLVQAQQATSQTLEKFVFMSSLAAYGPADNFPNQKVEARYKPQPIDTYGESKLAAEQFLQSQTNLPHLIFRPTAVFGPRDKDIFQFFEIINRGLEAYIGTQEQRATFIYVKDLVRLVIAATRSEVQQKSYFVADGNIYQTEDLGKHAKALLNKKTFKLKIPTGVVRVIAALLETGGKLTNTYPALNKEKVKILSAASWHCDVEPLHRDFNFQPQYNLETGLQETLKWYKENNWL